MDEESRKSKEELIKNLYNPPGNDTPVDQNKLGFTAQY